jgi:hypothetical protein
MYKMETSVMTGYNKSEEEIFSGDSMFETIFRWNREWTAIIVKPFKQDGKLLHYIVKLIGGPIIFLWKDEAGDWVELKKGKTERSLAVGRAIEYSFL